MLHALGLAPGAKDFSAMSLLITTRGNFFLAAPDTELTARAMRGLDLSVQIATKLEMSSISAGWGEADRVFDVLDAALQQGPWLLGERFSAADIAIGSGLNFAVRLFRMVPSRPSFDRYIDACAARPANRLRSSPL